MIQHLKPYPAYKDSGVEWLGQVPEHWVVLPGRTVFREINDRGHPDEQMLSVTITRGVLRQADLLAESSKKDSSNEDKSNYKLVQPGDLVYNKMRAWQGAVGVSAYRGIVSPAYIVQRLRSAENLPRYMHFLLRTPLFASEAERWSYGITSDQWSLRAEEFKCIYFSLPPLAEQTAIARFLDYMDRRIRRYIRAKEKLIKLLEEYKQALIHQAVTGKIDVRTGQPYPVYKSSGVEWLGEVPAHWDVVPLKRLAWFKSGSGFPVHHQGDTSAEIPFFKVSDMNLPGNEKYLRVCANTVSMTVARDLGATVLPAGTIIFPKVGGALLTNKRRIAVSHCCIDNNMMGCVARNGNRDFLFLIMSYIDLGKIAKPGPVPAISEGEVREIRVALPSAPEQTAIVEYLDAQTTKIDAAIAAARREIELLREYRTRLIADVVTGKVDVREVAARLPEEPSEEDAPWTDEEERAQDETLNGEGDHAAISEEDG